MEVVKDSREKMANPPVKSYDEVVDIANQYHQQNEELRYKLLSLMNDQSLTKLNFLMDLVANREKFPEDMVDKSITEIREILFPTKEDVQESK